MSKRTFSIISLISTIFLVNSLSGMEDSQKMNAEIWFKKVTGLTADSMLTHHILNLSYSDLIPEYQCFNEEELEHLCHLNTSAIRVVNIYRDSCPLEQKLTSKGMAQLGKCLPTLEAIDADYNNLTDSSFFNEFPLTMTEFRLIANKGLENANFQDLNRFPSLTSLNLQQIKLSQTAFETIISPSLHVLNLESTEITRLDEINRRLPSLRALSIRTNPLGGNNTTWSKKDHLALNYLKDLIMTNIHVFSEDALSWMMNESDVLWITESFKKDNLLQALSNKPSHKRLIINRLLDLEEIQLILSHLSERVVLIDNINFELLTTQIETMPEIPIHEFIFSSDIFFSEIIKQKVKKSFLGKQCKTMGCFLNNVYGNNITDIQLIDSEM